MSRVPYITIDGRCYLWRDILELRRAAIAESANTAMQLALFNGLIDDYRPIDARTASGRYLQPELFDTGM